HHRDPVIRWEAVSILEQIGLNEDAVAALLQAMGDDSTDVRRKAAAALSAPNVQLPKTAIPIFLNALGDELIVRASAIRILARIGAGNDGVLRALIDTLRQDASSHARAEAAASLPLVSPSTKEVVKALSRTLREDDDPNVRAKAAEVLQTVGRPAE